MDSQGNKKAKTHKGRLYLQTLAPKLIEDPKQSLFMNSDNSSEIMRMILGNLVRKSYKN
jgi:hypothetical protein